MIERGLEQQRDKSAEASRICWSNKKDQYGQNLKV